MVILGGFYGIFPRFLEGSSMKISHAMVSTAAVLAASILAFSAPAKAAVDIGLQENGGVITNTGDSSLTAFSFGTFTINASGTALTTPFGFDSNTLDTSSSTAGVLSVYVTETGLTTPAGTVPFTSTFTGNTIPSGWTVKEQTFLDTANGVFAVSGGTVDMLGSQTFTSFGVNQQYASVATGSDYSLTELYTITSTGVGTSNDTIDISAVPEPATWAMFLVGFGGIGFMMRGSRRKQTAALA
jgi:PEP-CTERM motif